MLAISIYINQFNVQWQYKEYMGKIMQDSFLTSQTRIFLSFRNFFGFGSELRVAIWYSGCCHKA